MLQGCCNGAHLPATALEEAFNSAGFLFVEHKDQHTVLAACMVLLEQRIQPILPGHGIYHLHYLRATAVVFGVSSSEQPVAGLPMILACTHCIDGVIEVITNGLLHAARCENR